MGKVVSLERERALRELKAGLTKLFAWHVLVEGCSVAEFIDIALATAPSDPDYRPRARRVIVEVLRERLREERCSELRREIWRECRRSR